MNSEQTPNFFYDDDFSSLLDEINWSNPSADSVDTMTLSQNLDFGEIFEQWDWPQVGMLPDASMAGADAFADASQGSLLPESNAMPPMGENIFYDPLRPTIDEPLHMSAPNDGLYSSVGHDEFQLYMPPLGNAMNLPALPRIARSTRHQRRPELEPVASSSARTLDSEIVMPSLTIVHEAHPRERIIPRQPVASSSATTLDDLPLLAPPDFPSLPTTRRSRKRSAPSEPEDQSHGVRVDSGAPAPKRVRTTRVTQAVAPPEERATPAIEAPLCLWNGGCGRAMDSKGLLMHLKKAHSEALVWDNKSVRCQWGDCTTLLGSATNLTRHVNNTHLKRRVQCRLCGRTYSRKSSLTRHEKSAHRELAARDETKGDEEDGEADSGEDGRGL